MTTRPTPAAWAALGTIAFAVLAAVGAWHHEMWRDELEIWLIARDSPDLGALFANMRTESHPALWYLLTWVVARVSSAPAAMQVLNVTLATGATWIWLRRAPFPVPLRFMLAFGYFPLYEFGVIARSYALQWLLIVAICALLPLDRARPRRTLAAAVLGLLACHTTLYGTFVVGALGVVLLGARWRGGERAGPRLTAAEYGAAGVWALGIATSVAHVWVQYSAIGETHLGVYRPTWDARWLATGLATFWRGFVPLPDPGSAGVWNTNVLDVLGVAAPYVGAVLGVAILGGALWALRRSPGPLVWLALGIAPMLAVTLFVWYGQLRQHGQPFLLLLAASWLAALTSPARGAWPRRLLTVLAALQIAAAGALLVTDAVRPFSRAYDVARVLGTDALASATVVGSWDYAAQPVAAWLERPIWYPEGRRYGTFMVWDDTRSPVTPRHALDDAERLLRETGGPVALVLNYEIAGQRVGDDEPLSGRARLRYVARLDGALVHDENYSVFLLYEGERGDSPAAAAPAP